MRPFEKAILAANLNYIREIRKQFLIALILTSLLIAIILIIGKIIFILFIPLLLTIYIVYSQMRYSNLKSQVLFNLQKEFVKLFTYFEIYTRNGSNIYNSLEALVGFASPNVKNYLETMLVQIDEDKSVMPFIHFGQRFHSLAIEQAMICIFQMVDQGNSEMRLLQFQNVFERISDQYYHDEIGKIRKGLDSLNTLPLIGAGLITVMITFGIIMMIGEVISGI
ncbi:MAG: hypothetical protein WCX85_04705 [Bacilli bacterium]|jgi:hypothetical protein|nr:hypothetical protein [Bacilli bacterium]